MREAVITIGNDQHKFSLIPSLGAMGISLVLHGRELLYLPNDFWKRAEKQWAGGLGYCFPICGRLTTMPVHGFGPYAEWHVIERTERSVTVQLVANAKTLSVYPYLFNVSLTFTVSPGLFTCQQRVSNQGDCAMPLYAGFHPYFLTPVIDKPRIFIDFKSIKRLQYNQTLTDVVREISPLQCPMPVSDPALNEQLNWVSGNNKATLHFPDGSRIETCVDGEQFHYIQLYTEDRQPFFCIEPWMNHPNAYHAPDVYKVPPGKTQENTLYMRLFL